MRYLSLLAAAMLLAGCEHAPTAPPPTSPVRWLGKLTPIELATYEGSGQATEPDVVETPAGWGAHRWHLTAVPFPFSQGQYENPSVYASDDGLTWTVEPGVVNPLVLPTAGHAWSDPCLVFVPEADELWLYARAYGLRAYAGDSLAGDSLYVFRSPDGVRWSVPRFILGAPLATALSPSVVHRGPGSWEMWTVNAAGALDSAHMERRTSGDGLVWSAAQPVTLVADTVAHWQDLDQRLIPWHVAVSWVPTRNAYWLISNILSISGGRLTRELWMASSPDGLAWSWGAAPVLAVGDDTLYTAVVYRTSFAVIGDSVRFWFSGARWWFAGGTVEFLLDWHLSTRANRIGDVAP